jgi:Tfp pilus assembly protein PilZ
VDTLKGPGDIANAKEVKTTNQDFFVPGGYCKYVSTSGTIDVSNVSVIQLGDKVNVSSITIDNTSDISITKEVTFISNGTTASIQHGNGIHLCGGKDCSMKQFDTVTLIGCRISPLEIIWVEKCRSVSDT